MRVCVYKNLNLGNWSVAEVSGRCGRGRKIAGVASIVLGDVTMHVQPAAFAKVASGEPRSVHAWFVGDIIAEAIGEKTAISINPKKRPNMPFFHTQDGRRVDRAACVELAADGRAYALAAQ